MVTYEISLTLRGDSTIDSVLGICVTHTQIIPFRLYTCLLRLISNCQSLEYLHGISVHSKVSPVTHKRKLHLLNNLVSPKYNSYSDFTYKFLSYLAKTSYSLFLESIYKKNFPSVYWLLYLGSLNKPSLYL